MSHTIEAPGAVLHYDVHPGEGPTLLMIASPMGADGFTALASHFTDRTVVTYDPRSAGRSRRTDGALTTRVEEHANDLHRLIAAVSDGPVDVFASSGGAVNALALVASHPEQVRTLVAHEPPAFRTLPDAGNVLAACADIHETYLRSGEGPAMAKFIALLMVQGPIPDDYLDGPDPDPAMFGMSAEDDGSRDDPLCGQNMMTCGYYEHDFDALNAAPTRIVIGVGADSGEEVAARAGVAVAGRLAVEPVTFPGGHGGFVSEDFAYPGKPAEFAAVLREILA
jgi:pimeloyl-ACP methyl ester carboxylesterase